jgi:hypothetical protein
VFSWEFVSAAAACSCRRQAAAQPDQISPANWSVRKALLVDRHRGKRFAASYGFGVVRAQADLVDRQGALKQREGTFEVALVVADAAELADGGGDIGMVSLVGVEVGLTDGEPQSDRLPA